MTKDGQRNLQLESLYHSIETEFGKVREKIVSGRQPAGTDLHAVVAFVAAQLVRTPKFRGSGRLVFQGDREAQLAEITDQSTRIAVEKTLATIIANGPQILGLHVFPKVLELLGKMRMRLYKTAGDMEFITSDAPCCVIECRDSIASVFECLESATSNVLMPLCPSVVVIFDHSSGPHEMRGLFPNQPIVHEINAMIWSGAMEQVVLPRQTVKLEWFSEHLITRLAHYAVL